MVNHYIPTCEQKNMQIEKTCLVVENEDKMKRVKQVTIRYTSVGRAAGTARLFPLTDRYCYFHCINFGKSVLVIVKRGLSATSIIRTNRIK